MKKFLVLIAAVFAVTTAYAQPTTCPAHFANGAAPTITSQKLAAKTTPLCFEAYAVMHSGVSHTPLWSAEHLTKSRLSDAKSLKRHNAFHAEEQVPEGDRAELRDYARSGYDRGHMSPSGDMPTENAQQESFSLANMIPQNSNNNQVLWEGIEESTRALTMQRGELYVVTGPIFEGSAIARINSRVFVPTFVFKAIYDPIRKEAAAYVTPNVAGSDYQIVSIAELEKRININLFPDLSAHVKETKMALPAPRPHGHQAR
jgi:endonuclease G, mitochondrial